MTDTVIAMEHICSCATLQKKMVTKNCDNRNTLSYQIGFNDLGKSSNIELSFSQLDRVIWTNVHSKNMLKNLVIRFYKHI